MMPASLYKNWAAFGASATLQWPATRELSGGGGCCNFCCRQELAIAVGEGCFEFINGRHLNQEESTLFITK
jgi:hypothetical protein